MAYLKQKRTILTYPAECALRQAETDDDELGELHQIQGCLDLDGKSLPSYVGKNSKTKSMVTGDCLGQILRVRDKQKAGKVCNKIVLQNDFQIFRILITNIHHR